MTAVRKDMAELAAARSTIYTLLASIFRAPPSPELIEEMRGPKLSPVLAQLDFQAIDILKVSDPSILSEILNVEFTGLFIGPGPHISPHESIHTEHGGHAVNELWGRETAEVKVFIEATGLSISNDFEGMPDHISAEFELMAHLADHEANLWASGKLKDAVRCSDIQKRFFRDHLDQWVPRFCKKVIAWKDARFYAAFAKLTEEVMEFERMGSTDLLPHAAEESEGTEATA